MRGRLYSVVSEETVVKSRWSLIRVVVHVEFHCTYNIFVTFPCLSRLHTKNTE